jgi:hypothetical protein
VRRSQLRRFAYRVEGITQTDESRHACSFFCWRSRFRPGHGRLAVPGPRHNRHACRHRHHFMISSSSSS